MLAVLAACAPAERTAPGDRPVPVDDEPAAADSVIVDEADESPEGLALAEAERAWVAGDYDLAIDMTDSLAAAWSRRPGVGEQPVRRLARLLLARAEDPEAVEQLLSHPEAIDESWRGEIRAAVERMSIGELDDLSRRISRDPAAVGIVRAELARSLALAGEDDRARELARDLDRLDDDELHDADRRKVEDVLAGRVRPEEARVRIGMVVPRSGGFAPVGDQLIEGARLAAARYEQETGVPVELGIVDEATAVDSAGRFLPFGDAFARPDPSGDEEPDEDDREVLLPGRPTGPPSRLDAIVGPVTTEALKVAAESRARPGLLVLSPTASEDSGLPPHAYSLWDRARRDSLEATTLANWLVSAFRPNRIEVLHADSAVEAGPARIGALHPDDDSGHRRARIFAAVVDSAGFEWVGAEPYHADSTTYESQITALTAADPDFVYTIADGPRQVLQLAPQLHFYGLRGRITLVNQDWTHPVALRRLDEQFSEYRTGAVYLEREGNPEWERFASDWDREYRRALPDNAFAGLGYDAISLVLRSIENPALTRPAAVARAARRLEDVQGATGQFSFDPERRRLARDARVLMILNAELVEPDPQAIVDWSIEKRELERQRLEREAEEEARDAARRAESTP